MAKKRVEENAGMEEQIPDMDTMYIDTSVNEVRTEIPLERKNEEPAYQPAEKRVYRDEPMNCLRNEKIIVKFVPSPTAMIHNKNHILYGGMAENATRSFVVPRLSNGQLANVLTNNEKAFLEQAMGLEYNALSIYRKNDNFWENFSVTLHKQNNYLDLSVPIDYIKYKVLLINKDKIAPSLQELEDRPKATYQFVIVSEDAETKMNLSKMDATKRCYMEYGKIEDDKDTLRVIIETFEGRPTTNQIKLDYLQGKINDYIQSDARKFLRIIQDELLPAKVLIKRSVEAGLISRRNDLYYYDGTPMCEMGEDSTFTNAARWLCNIKRSELKYTLEAKLKQ